MIYMLSDNILHSYALRTMQIYMRSTEFLGYNTKQNKWIFDVVFKQAPIKLQAPLPDPILSPQSVTNWKISDPRLNTLVPTTVFRVEQSSEMEYQKIYKGITIVKKLCDLNTLKNKPKQSILSFDPPHPGCYYHI